MKIIIFEINMLDVKQGRNKENGKTKSFTKIVRNNKEIVEIYEELGIYAGSLNSKCKMSDVEADMYKKGRRKKTKK